MRNPSTVYLSNVGPHIIVDRGTETEIARVLDHVALVKPNFITVMGGARFTQAVEIGQELLTNERFDPQPRIILRKWPDDGNWKKPQYKDPDKWFEENQHLIEQGFLLKASNEDNEMDLTNMSHWLARQVHLAGSIGQGVAVGSFATGNPHESQFSFDPKTRKGQMTPLAEALHIWHDYSIYAPHEYVALSHNRTAGHPFRYKQFWNMCDALELERPTTVIGEHGLLVNMDPYKGWKLVDFDGGREYYEFLKPFNKQWYLPHGVDLQIFSYLEWDKTPSIHVDEAFMVALEVDAMGNQLINRSPQIIKQKKELPDYVEEPEPEPEPKPEPDPGPQERIKELVINLDFLKEVKSDRIPDEIRIQFIYKEENDGSDSST